MSRGIMAMAMAAGAFVGSAHATGEVREFERVFPSVYSDLLRDSKVAYTNERYEQAFRAFQRAACTGDKESQSVLGRMYLLGRGVERDDLKGYAWLKVAAEVIFPGYQKIVRQIEDALSPEQRRRADAEAERLIKAYGLAASGMSCRKNASRGGHIYDQIVCTPRKDGNELRLRVCAEPER